MTLYQGGAVVFLLGGLLLLVCALAMFWESYALWTDNVLITSVTRGYIDHHRMLAMAMTGFVLILIGHFWT